MFKFKNNTPEKTGAKSVCPESNVTKVKEQISKLYISSVLGNLSLTGAWVAILAARGFSLVEIGAAETVFHITSLIFEIPSGVLADVFGRRKMLIVSTVMRMTANVVMILSGQQDNSIAMVCVSLAFHALAYNFSSGTGDALAYDSLKLAGMESGFDKYNANQLVIYRLCSGISTLCAGIALFIGYKAAYSTDLITGVIQIFLLMSLYEVYPGNNSPGKSKRDIAAPAAETVNALKNCFTESLAFIKNARKAVGLMLCNSLVGAADILLLFYLQAKLTERGLPEKALGFALLFMEMGGIAGSKISVKLPKISYRKMFAAALLLVILGIAAEHSPLWLVMTAGGFLSAMADDALQVRTNAILQDMFPSEQRATLTSLESFSFSVIMILLTLPAGAFFTHW